LSKIEQEEILRQEYFYLFYNIKLYKQELLNKIIQKEKHGIHKIY
jgi:hypothetical protein